MSDPSDLSVLLQIEARALEARTLAALRFTVVNETNALRPYRQAAFFEQENGRLRLTAASGLVSVASDSPFSVWLNQFAQRLPQDGAIHCLDLADAPAIDAEQWAEWLPDHLLLVPLKRADGAVLALSLLAREQAWEPADVEVVARLHLIYAHCLAAFLHQPAGVLPRIRQALSRRHRWKWLVAVVVALLMPVRLSVLAPAEVIALNAVAVSAPQDGVVGSFAVAPNTRVKAGDLLFSLDESMLTNRLQVARKSLEVAQADAHIAQQRAFDDTKSKADVAVAQGRVREKEAELAAIDTQAQRVEIRADRDGVAIYADPNDWLGRPVQTGERVMQLAQPEDGGILVWLAVADAINLELEAPVRLFLHTEPLSPRGGRLTEASYHASLSPDGVASYRLRAQFDNPDAIPRIGLRGTARISGEWVVLGYYLFRRPLATLREWTGL